MSTWAKHLFSLEIRKLLSYRVDFWLGFLGGVFIELLIAFCLWKSVFDARGNAEVGGYQFGSMILYYLLIALVRRAVMSSDFGFISTEIYDGSLNRYLVYPVSFFHYKYVAWMANGSIAVLQLLLALGVYLAVFGIPADRHLSLWSLILGIVAIWGASSLYFFMTVAFELVAFWAENVWSLLVMLRFGVQLLGGGLLPLALFPGWFKPVTALLPFGCLLSFPIRCIMGEVAFSDWLIGMSQLGFWTLMMSGVVALIWRRGTLQYTGVGV